MFCVFTLWFVSLFCYVWGETMFFFLASSLKVCGWLFKLIEVRSFFGWIVEKFLWCSILVICLNCFLGPSGSAVFYITLSNLRSWIPSPSAAPREPIETCSKSLPFEISLLSLTFWIFGKSLPKLLSGLPFRNLEFIEAFYTFFLVKLGISFWGVFCLNWLLYIIFCLSFRLTVLFMKLLLAIFCASLDCLNYGGSFSC